VSRGRKPAASRVTAPRARSFLISRRSCMPAARPCMSSPAHR
jgi:hypothetical protein